MAEQAPAPTADPASEEALKILTKAQKTMLEFKTFKAEILNADETSKTKSKTTLYQRNNPDGFMEMRMELEFEIAKTKHTSTFITNRDGYWQLTPTTAIKMEFQGTMAMMAQQTMAGFKKEEIQPSKYSLSEMAINGKSYWIVKEVFPEDVRQKVRGMLNNNPQVKEMLKNASPQNVSIPMLNLYRIGKEDGMLHSMQHYDDKGNKLSDVTHENMQINIPLADNLFTIPSKLKIKIAKTVDDYSAVIVGEFK